MRGAAVRSLHRACGWRGNAFLHGADFFGGREKNYDGSRDLSADGSHPLQKAWLEEQVAQCGYCQSGMIMTCAALLAENPKPSECGY